MPRFTYNGTTYNVADKDMEFFKKEYPDAVTQETRNGTTYNVKASDYDSFMDGTQQPSQPQEDTNPLHKWINEQLADVNPLGWLQKAANVAGQPTEEELEQQRQEQIRAQEEKERDERRKNPTLLSDIGGGLKETGKNILSRASESLLENAQTPEAKEVAEKVAAPFREPDDAPWRKEAEASLPLLQLQTEMALAQLDEQSEEWKQRMANINLADKSWDGVAEIGYQVVSEPSPFAGLYKSVTGKEYPQTKSLQKLYTNQTGQVYTSRTAAEFDERLARQKAERTYESLQLADNLEKVRIPQWEQEIVQMENELARAEREGSMGEYGAGSSTEAGISRSRANNLRKDIAERRQQIEAAKLRIGQIRKDYAEGRDPSVKGQLELVEQLLQEAQVKLEARKEEVRKSFYANYEMMNEGANAWQRQMTSGTLANVNAIVEGDKTVNALELAIDLYKDTLKALSNQSIRDKGGDVGFWYSALQTASDISTWDVLSIGGWLDMLRMLNVASGNVKTDAEKEAQQVWMGAMLQNSIVHSMTDANRSLRDIAGEQTIQMIPFMLQFFLAGGENMFTRGIGKATQKGAMRLAGKEIGQSLMEKGFINTVQKYGWEGLSRSFGYYVAKGLGATATDIAKAAEMMTTSQAGQIAQSTVARKYSDVQVDENGNLYIGPDESWSHAIWTEAMDMLFEDMSERWGMHMGNVLTKKSLGQLANVMGIKRFGDQLLRADASAYSNMMKQTQKFFNMFGVNNFIEEVGEEYWGQLLRSIFKLDTAYTYDEDGERINLFRSDRFHAELWAGMVMSMGALEVATRGYNSARKARAEHLLRKMDGKASKLIGEEQWEELKQQFEDTTNDNVGAFLNSLARDYGFNSEQFGAAMNYMTQALGLRGMNWAEWKQAQIVARRSEIEGDINNAVAGQQQRNDKAYLEGYNTTDGTERNATSNMLTMTQMILNRVLGKEQGNAIIAELNAAMDDPQKIEEIIDKYRGSWGVGAQTDETTVVREYIAAKQRYDGMIQRSRDDIDAEIAQWDTEVDSYINKQNGKVIGATMKQDDRRVYIIDGVVVPYADRTGINTQASDKSVVIMDANTGKIEMVSPTAIMNVDDQEYDPDEMKRQGAESIRASMAQESADQINGTVSFNEGATFTLEIGGRSINVTVTPNEDGVIDNGDGTVNVMTDGQIAPLSKRYIQQQVSQQGRQRAMDALRGFMPAQNDKYQLNQKILIRDADGNVVEAVVTSRKNEDGKYTVSIGDVRTGRVQEMTEQEIDNSIVGEAQQEEQGTEQAPAQEQQPQQQKSALEQIPVDENGQRVYENAPSAEVAWDAMLEQNEGDVARTQKWANAMVRQKEAALKAVQEAQAQQEGQIDDPTMSADDINARITAQEQALAQAQQQLDFWRAVANEQQRRVEAQAQAQQNQKQAEQTEEKPSTKSEETASTEAQPQGHELTQGELEALANYTQFVDELEETIKKMGLNVPVVVAGNARELIAAMQEVDDQHGTNYAQEMAKRLRDGEQIEGFYLEGKVYLFAPQLFNGVQQPGTAENHRQKAMQRAYEVIAHETVAHRGLRKLLGKAGFNKLCDNIFKGMSQYARDKYLAYHWNYNLSEEKRESMLSGAGTIAWNQLTAEQRKQIMDNKANADEMRRGAADEYAAHLAEKVLGNEELTAKEQSVWDKILSAIRKLFGQMDDTAIAQALVDARDNLRKGGQVQENTGEGGTRFSMQEAEETLSGVKGQKQVDTTYEPLTQDEIDGIRFSIGKKRKEQMEAMLGKRRPEMTDREKNALFFYLDDLNNTKEENATFRWFVEGTVRLPEDKEKIRQAIKTAERAKVDPMQYSSPDELMEIHEKYKPKNAPIDPATLGRYLYNKKNYGNGIVVYNVIDGWSDEEDIENCRKALRRVIDTHWGEKANPWCLLQGDGKGNLTSSSDDFWDDYDRFPKKIAFKDGKLLAFFAAGEEESGPTWWDSQDHPYRGIPVTMRMPNDELGRIATYEYCIPMDGVTDYKKGTYEDDREDAEEQLRGINDQLNKAQERLDTIDERLEEIDERLDEIDDIVEDLKDEDEEANQDGIESLEEERDQLEDEQDKLEDEKDKLEKDVEGYEEEKDDWENQIAKLNNKLSWRDNYTEGLGKPKNIHTGNKKNGVYTEWYDNKPEQIKERTHYKDGMMNGLREKWNRDGQIDMRANYKDDERDGLQEEWYSDGQQSGRANYKNGLRDGLWEEWYSNGQMESRENYKDDERDGLQEYWHKNGQIKTRCNYKDGKQDGAYESWYENGQLRVRDNFKEGERDGLYEYWWENGQIKERANYKDGKENGLSESWEENGRQYSRLMMEDGRVVKDLTFEDEAPRFSVEEVEKTLSGVKGQQQAGVEHPQLASDEIDDIRFSVGRKRKEAWNNILDKRRPDVTAKQRRALFDYLDGLNNTKEENVSFKWFVEGSVALPVEQVLIQKAIEVAERAKVDPMQYKSPADLTSAFPDLTKRVEANQRIDPDTLGEYLTNKQVLANGITVYDVVDGPAEDPKVAECRQWLRKIIDTHWGEDAEPWCLLATSYNGALGEDSAYAWNTYNKDHKRIAFKDGKLLAFFASSPRYGNGVSLWWDRGNQAYADGIPVMRKMPNDELGRTATYPMDEKTGKYGEPYNIHKGNKQNGTYEEWNDHDRHLIARENYKDGKLDGVQEYWSANSPQLLRRESYKDGVKDGLWEKWDGDGHIVERENYKDGKLDGLREQWWDSANGGRLKARHTIKDNKRVGVSEEWYSSGRIERRENYNEEGELDGLQEYWFPNGDIKRTVEYTDGKKNGDEKFWAWSDLEGRSKPAYIDIYENGELLDIFPSTKGMVEEGKALRKRGEELSAQSQEETEGARFSVDEAAKVLSTVEGQKQAGVRHETSMTANQAISDLRFSVGHNIGKKARAEMLEMLKANRPEMTDDQCEALMTCLNDLHMEAGRLGPKMTQAAFKWFMNGEITLPNDKEKVVEAIERGERAQQANASRRAKGLPELDTNPLNYISPLAMMDALKEYKRKAKPIDPDTMGEYLTNKQVLANGVVVYDVVDGKADDPKVKECREALRRIIDTHWGEDRNPWCLLQQRDGKLTEYSAQMWDHYNKYPKRIAFKDGKLMAFFASNDRPEWWNEIDHAFEGIPVTRKMDGDELGRTATYEMDEQTGKWGTPTEIHKGNRQNGLYEEWWDEDPSHIHHRINYKNGKLDGLVESWYSNGQLLERGTFKDGQANGLVEHWYNDGTREIRATYKDGRLEGLREDWYRNGQPKMRATYKDNMKEGLCEEWHDNGQLENRGEYVKGNKVGLHEDWYDNGQMATRATYDSNSNIDGLWESWYRNGNKKEREYWKDGEREGLREHWHENGRRRSRINYKNGVKDGLMEEWNDNGKRRTRTNYKDGKIDGLDEAWYSNGNQIFRVNYKDGQQDGLTERWFEDGKLEQRENWKDGQKNGVEEQWYPNRQLMRREHYKNDQSDGLYEEWFDNGQMYKHVEYKNGGRDGIYEEWWDNGQMLYRYNYKDNEKNGLCEEWYGNGQMEERGHFKDGKRDGMQERYYDTGQIHARATYKDGKPNGMYEQWHSNGQRNKLTFWKDGKLEGEQSVWNDEGSLIEQSNYKDGKLDGESRGWSNGRLTLLSHYKDGEWHGMFETWYPNGQLSSRGNWDNGIKVGLHEQWYEDGQWAKHENYDDKGNFDGLQADWFANGQLAQHVRYENGEMEGLFEKWHSNGQIARRMELKNGSRNGEYKMWDEDGEPTVNAIYKDDELVENLPLEDIDGESSEPRFSVSDKKDNAERVLANVRGQKQAGVEYDIPESDMDDMRFSVSRRRKEQMEATLAKVRTDMSDEEKKALFDYLDTLDNPVLEQATFNWFTVGAIKIPEDMYKVRQAVKVAKLAKVDPADTKRFPTPLDLVNQFKQFKVKDEPINPDEVPTLTNKKDYGDGITVYDVDDGDADDCRESRKWMRKIIDTHWGVDAQPWCLLQSDDDGNLTEESDGHWNDYNRFGKKVAFKDGKLLAFFGAGPYEDGPTWWDSQDNSHRGIPVTRKMDGDELGRSATYEYLLPEEDIDDKYAPYVPDKDSGDWSQYESYGTWREDWEAGWDKPNDIHRGNMQNGTYEEWHDNGQLRKRFHYKDGKLEGLCEEWYDNGQIRATGNYRNGEAEGLHQGWHENGQLEYQNFWKDGKIDGLSEWWYEDGKQKSRSNHKNGLPDGLSESWATNGQLTSRENYKDGREDGLQERWTDKGQITRRANYTNGHLDGLCEEWYFSGKPQERVNYRNGKKNGMCEVWHYNGQLEQRTNWKDDELDGLQEYWHEDGTPRLRETYKDGNLDGLLESWYDNGPMRKRENYRNGRYDGTQESWDETGTLILRQNYKNGKKDGLFEEYDRVTGQLIERENFKNNEKDGLQESWYRDGTPRSRETYKNGKMEGEYATWYKNGQMRERDAYKNGVRDGLSEEWWGNGQILKRGTFENGKPVGIREYWFENGQQQERVNYKDGKLDGVDETWHYNGQLEARENYKAGEHDGLQEYWYDDGQPRLRETYKDGKLDGERIRWNEDGFMVERALFKNGDRVKDLPLDDDLRFSVRDNEDLFSQAARIAREYERQRNGGGQRYSTEEQERILSGVKGQKVVGVTHERLDPDEINDIRFSIGKRRKEQMEATLNKRRKDMTDDEKRALFDYLDELDNTKEENATFKWFVEGTVRLPDDREKIRQAIKTAELAKVDPMQYNSPDDLMEVHKEYKPKDAPIDPDTVPTLYNKKSYGNGIVVYDVYDGYADECEESREWLRKILNTHRGEDANPWCLLAGDGHGNLTEESADYWDQYNRYGKKVAFKDGKLLAFFAEGTGQSPTWWNLQDNPYGGIPVTMKMPNDKLGRTATYEYYIPLEDIENMWEYGDDWAEPYRNENYEAGLSEPKNIHKGNEKNGTYETWWDENHINKRENRKDGKKDGVQESWSSNGVLLWRSNYKEGKLDGLHEKWNSDGVLVSRAMYKDGERNGVREAWYPDDDGSMVRDNWKNNKRDGVCETWNENGQLVEREHWKDGKMDGLYEWWYDNGQIRERAMFKNDKRNGLTERWHENGQLKNRDHWRNNRAEGLQESWHENGQKASRIKYRNDKPEGLAERWYDNGQLSQQTTYVDGKIEGFDEKWYEDGQLMERESYKDGKKNGITEKWEPDGTLRSREMWRDGWKVEDLPLDEDIRFSVRETAQKSPLDELSTARVAETHQEGNANIRQNSENAIENEDLFAQAERIANDYHEQWEEQRREDEEEIRMSNQTDGEHIVDWYERMVRSGVYQWNEAMQDSMLSLKKVMEEVYPLKKGEYVEDIPDFENAYMGENRLSSVNEAELNAVQHLLVRPMLRAVSKLTGGKMKNYEVLVNYMMAKHGLERNAYMAERDAQVAYDEYTKRYPNGTKTLQDFIDEKRMKDYAGLTALTGEKDVAAAEYLAQQMVDDYEANHDTNDVNDLWDKVHALTDMILSKQYESGYLSTATYDKIRGMYQYYIPLRGFDEKTSEDEYAYIGFQQGVLNTSIHEAWGRKSKADDPFANMQAMAEGVVLQGNRNMLVKQRFMNFAMNHHTDLVSISELWLEKRANGEWEPAIPDYSKCRTAAEMNEATRKFEEDMEKKAAAEPDKYAKASDSVNIPYRVLRKDQLKQHQVIVRRGGRDYILTINGSPRLAQALNGETNPDNPSNHGWVMTSIDLLGAVNRAMSGIYTTMSPDFIVSNFSRDMIYANSMVWVKESPAYARRFHTNVLRANPVHLKVLLAKYRNGTLDMNDATEKMFYDFIRNGGETGYARRTDTEEIKRKTEKKLRSLNEKIPATEVRNLAATVIGEFGRAVEMSARFAAFMTSREQGRDIGRSIWDAKEISVNFNKKGSGDKFLFAQGQNWMGNAGAFLSAAGRASILFWNASLQGTFANFLKNIKRHPWKGSALVASYFAFGMIRAFLASIGGSPNDDDDDSYFNFSQYTRRSNLMIKGTGKAWIKIPLSIEYRAAYGLGEMWGSAMFRGEKITMNDYLEQVCQLLPVDMTEGRNEHPKDWTGKLGNWLKPLIPAAAKPLFEVGFNYNYMGQPIYRDKTEWNQYRPAWTRAFSTTNQWLVDLFRRLNERGGGNEIYKGEGIDINPAGIEYLLRSYMPFYTFVNEIMSSMDVITGKKDFNWYYIPLANRLLANGDERTAYRAMNNDFYEVADEYDKTKYLYTQYRKASKAGSKEMEIKLNELEASPEYARYRCMRSTMNNINECQRDINNLKNKSHYGGKNVANDLKKKEKKLMKYKEEILHINKQVNSAEDREKFVAEKEKNKPILDIIIHQDE